MLRHISFMNIYSTVHIIKMSHHAKTIVKNNNEAIALIENLTEKLVEIFNAEKNKHISRLHEKIKIFQIMNDKIEQHMRSDSTDACFQLINNIEICSTILQEIYVDLSNVLDKTKNVETFLSQTYIDETIQFHKRIALIYSKIKKDENKYKEEMIDEFAAKEIKSIMAQTVVLSATYILNYVRKIQSLYHSHIYAIDLYIKILHNIFEHIPIWLPGDTQLSFNIKSLIEHDKSFILGDIYQVKKKSTEPNFFNPYFKSFNLIPITKSMGISEVSKIFFDKSAKNINEFVKHCKLGDYGLIVINMHIRNPITYNVSQLLDWKESQKFSQTNKVEFGVDADLLERYATIDKIPHKNKWNFSTEVFNLKKYEEDINKFVVILDSLSDGLYRINTNFLSMGGKYFVRVSSIYELYKYCTDTKKNTSRCSRVSNLHSIHIEKALPNIFSPIKPDLKKIGDIAAIVDPKYLRNEIYLRLNETFKKILEIKYKDGKNIKDSYTYALIIHDEEFLNIFSDIIVSEFHAYIYKTYDEYTMGHIQIGEIISTFMNTIYIYQRTFTKEIHDYFKDTPFDFESDNVPTRLRSHFNDMTKNTLEKIITGKSNIYQTTLYKINLLKNTFI